MMVPRHQPPELDAGDQTRRRRIAGVARDGADRAQLGFGARARLVGVGARAAAFIGCPRAESRSGTARKAVRVFFK